MNEFLSVQNLSKRYGTRSVIEALSFSINQGDRVTIFAPSGSGKTTLINILNGLDTDYSGQFELQSLRPATLFQESRLFPHLTVQENIFLPFEIKGVPLTDNIQVDYRKWLEICDLQDRINSYPYQLSGGMRQKVALIRCFLMQPDFVLMDEPFTSIDIEAKKRIVQSILLNYPGITLLFATHNLEEISLITQWLIPFTGNQLKGRKEIKKLTEFRLTDLFDFNPANWTD